MEYLIQNQKINLNLNDLVFKPSPHGSSALGGSIKVNPGEEVLDVGTGTGLLAILAAKLGGKVCATDILPEAIKLAKENAEANGVSLDFRQGDLLYPFNKKKFDVIIANVPQENLSPKIIGALPQEIVTGMHGGQDGNELLLKVLKSAPDHMSPNSRLYVVIYSMSNFRKSLEEILKRYQTTLINFYTGPVKDFVYSDKKWYEEQSDEGKIAIYKKDGQYWADLYVLELRLK